MKVCRMYVERLGLGYILLFVSAYVYAIGTYIYIYVVYVYMLRIILYIIQYMVVHADSTCRYGSNMGYQGSHKNWYIIPSPSTKSSYGGAEI